MRIKKTVTKLVTKYKTNCPYRIAEHKNIRVQKEPLGSVYGYFHTYRRVPMIHINSELDDSLQRFVCAHELGHAVLHPRSNTPFLRANTMFSVERIEREANEIAVELLMPDTVVREHESIYDAAASCGVPEKMAGLKRFEGFDEV